MADSRVESNCQHRLQGDLVVEGFRRLRNNKYPLQLNETPAQSLQKACSTLSLEDEAKFKQGLVDQLQSTLLPLLHRQITALSLSLNRSALRNDPGPNLQLILEIQSELECTMDQVQSHITAVFPESTSSPHSADDHHLESLKSYRLRRLKSLFDDSGVPSDLRYSVIWEIATITNPPPPDLKDDCPQVMMKMLQHKPIIHLARLFIPIFKLCKIFFVKISKRGMNSKRLPLFTKMSSEQIESLANSIGDINCDLIKFFYQLHEADQTPGAAAGEEFVKLATQLKTYFETLKCLMQLHYLPMIPDNNGLQDRTYYSSWFVTWDTHFQLSIHNFKQAAQSLHDTP
ncbi:hypothetical protein PTTG_12559 [Puccinia triticina 1-1 BBBD Race 1]|uniref:Uncharacterized protein n=1 Tax=Puccinia triticina (isolate 1-1 / race 1 (BBBD)) TaxID=630390 RepID=A0A180GMK1_PUCT1|nr:hypothetical protein PTTG_12559 [Puccinia triticina 1-1 BBBD Race 1]WAR63420.1 hypothetical protein PtB15_17B19 [Puccinia triticina]